MTECVRSVNFSSPADKASWLDASARLDARLPRTRELARALHRSARAHDPVDLARWIHWWVRDRVSYVRDPGCEEFSDSDLVLARGYGDCDDKARAFVALCVSSGLEARIVPVYRGHAFVHVAAEVRLRGGWTFAETIIRGTQLGERPTSGEVV